jgi:hypothetical protein
MRKTALCGSHTALDREAEMRALRDRHATLSRREREVMALVVSGLLNKQVGGELGIRMAPPNDRPKSPCPNCKKSRRGSDSDPGSNLQRYGLPLRRMRSPGATFRAADTLTDRCWKPRYLDNKIAISAQHARQEEGPPGPAALLAPAAVPHLAGDCWTSAPGAYLPAASSSGTTANRHVARAGLPNRRDG